MSGWALDTVRWSSRDSESVNSPRSHRDAAINPAKRKGAQRITRAHCHSWLVRRSQNGTGKGYTEGIGGARGWSGLQKEVIERVSKLTRGGSSTNRFGARSSQVPVEAPVTC